MKTNNIRLLNNDILIKPYSDNESIIELIDTRSNDVNKFEVVKVSENCDLVSSGDVVIVEFGNHTLPVILDDGRYAITTEEHIIAIIV